MKTLDAVMNVREAKEARCSPSDCRTGMVLFLRIETKNGPVFLAFCQEHLEEAARLILGIGEGARAVCP